MRCVDIPPTEWADFCERFSRRHRGQLAATFVKGAGDTAATRCTARDLPFAAVTLDPNQRDITLCLGEGKLHITECVHEVASLFMLEGENGAETGLRIDRTDDSGVMLTMHATDLGNVRGGHAKALTPSQPSA
ncbi:DUF5335 family protein [Methylotetracoccus oryzae]|uniref:DUF5335 family protein n=1 Tax=Methylotetracoccus oryzae TaxID=1919059 RepID=UPI00111A9F18|nr:DUF5335 family protein [Methylotetracoccus oryzae]